MHRYEGMFFLHLPGEGSRLLARAHPEEPQDTPKDTHMNIARKIGITVAATLVSFSLVGVSAPAQADSSWGWRTPVSSR